MGSVGSDQSSLGGSTGGVVDANGALLLSTDTTGETSLMFGPAALREIQAGVANGDFAIPPSDPTASISDANSLPYWTFTDDSSAGAITCAVVQDSTSGSGNILQWTVAANTTTSKTATMSRYVPIPVTQDRAYSFFPEFAVAVTAGSTNRSFIMTMQFYTDGLVATGTAITHTYALTSFNAASRTATFIQGDADQRLNPPADARFAKISMQVTTTGTNATATIFNVYEVKLLTAPPMVLLGSRTSPAAVGPAAIWNNGLQLYISNQIPDTWSAGTLTTTLNNIRIAGTDITLTAPTINSSGALSVSGSISNAGAILSQYENIGGADSTTITTAGTYYALTSASNSSGFLDLDFTPKFVGQRWLFTFTAYASLNTAVAQYAFIRADVTTSAAVAIVSPWAYSRSENPGTSGKGGTVAITKVWVADRTTACKFKLYGTTQTTNGLILSTSYSALTAYPIG